WKRSARYSRMYRGAPDVCSAELFARGSGSDRSGIWLSQWPLPVLLWPWQHLPDGSLHGLLSVCSSDDIILLAAFRNPETAWLLFRITNVRLEFFSGKDLLL